MVGDAQQSLAADGAIACFSSNCFPLSSDADRAPQLKASVMLLPLGKIVLKIMKPINPKLLAAVAILCSLSVFGSHAQEKKLSEADAIGLAEQFIAQNGYTDLPPDKGKLAYERIEWESNADEMLRGRRDTLERKAYGIVPGGKGVGGWTVVFRYKHPSTRQMRRNGRAVTMTVGGGNMRMEHQDFILKFVDKRL